jgi:hypothetical protein
MPGPTQERPPGAAAPESWDPLQTGSDDLEFVLAAQKREIRNILKSYTGYYDLFSELIQNALDAVEKRSEESSPNYQPEIWITIDIPKETVSITDNGCAMTLAQFRGFLKPNFSFKQGASTRGSKGVGATYLAYGFNYLEMATKVSAETVLSGVIENGRRWLDDTDNIVSRPKVQPVKPTHGPFLHTDRGLLSRCASPAMASAREACSISSLRLPTNGCAYSARTRLSAASTSAVTSHPRSA